MTHSSAKIKWPDGTVRYGEYNGTADFMLPFLYETIEEVEEHWRRTDWARCEVTGHPREHVVIGVEGNAWVSEVCPECNVITGFLSVWEVLDQLGRHEFDAGLAQSHRFFEREFGAEE